MYNLYYKGLLTDVNELDEIKRFFKENNVSLTPVFENYATLPLTSIKNLNAALQDKFREANPMGQQANLICHSMGCNLGVLTTIKTPKVKKLVLISPQFGNYTEEELDKQKNEKIKSPLQRPYGEQKTKTNNDKIKSLIVFNKTQQLAKVAIEKINVPTLIIYSKDDAFIPKEYLQDLSERKDNITLATIDTKMNNPLTHKPYREKTLKLIKRHII